MQGHVFISYVSEDKQVVDRLQQLLAAADVPVWRDKSNLEPGDDWWGEIQAAITNGALAFIACFSEQSVAKARTVQRKEIDLAIEELRVRSPEKKWFIPVRLTDCAIPNLKIDANRTLRNFEWVDLFGDRWTDGVARLLPTIQRIFSSSDGGESTAPPRHVAPDRGPASIGLLDVPEQAILRGVALERRWSGTLPRQLRHLISSHGGGGGSVCAVPVEGRMLLASTGFGSVRLWDPATAEPHSELLANGFGMVHASCLVPLDDERALLATSNGHRGIQLWDVATGKAVGEPLEGHTDDVTGLCAVPLSDRTLVASGGSTMDSTVRLWDPVTGEQVDEPLKGGGLGVRAICAVPIGGGRTLLATGHTDEVRLWDPATGQPYGEPLSDLDPGTGVYDMCPVPVDDRMLLATANGDGTVRLWDPVAGIPYGMPLRGHTGIVLAVCALPVGDRVLLASTGHGKAIRLWDPAAGRAVGEPLMGHAGWVGSLCAFPVGDDMVLASASLDGTVRLWGPAGTGGGSRRGTTEPGQPGPRLPMEDILRQTASRIPWPDELPQQELFALRGESARRLRAVCVVPGADRMLVAAAGDKAVHLWDPGTGRPYSEPLTGAGERSGVSALCALYLGDRWLLASGEHAAMSEGTIRFWDPVSATPVGQPIVTGPVLAMCAVEVRGTRGQRMLLATADDENTVWLWDPTTAQPHGPPLRGHDDWVSTMCAVPALDRTLLATAGRDRTVRLWDPATGGTLRVLPKAGRFRRGHTNAVTSVCAVPAGDRMLLATGSEDWTVGLWDPATGRPVGQPLIGHTAGIRAVCALPVGNGMLLASAGWDEAIRLWDPTNGQPVGEPLTGHTDGVSALCAVALPGRTLLASVDYGATLRLWGPTS